jgi:integrase/recombinase XerD
MLTEAVERYLALRRSLGFKLRDVERQLRAFAAFAEERGDSHVRMSTALDWAAAGSSPHVCHVRLRAVVRFARFVRAEDPAHEVPLLAHFPRSYKRPLPYIYASDEISRILGATRLLRRTYPLRRRVYATLLGLLAATGLRISEALNLRLGSVWPGGILHVEETKFKKSRLVPLHPTAMDALDEFLDERRRIPTPGDHLFFSRDGGRLSRAAVEFAFRRLVDLAGIAPARDRRPRIHDMRHSFATRALERCSTERSAVSRHFLALSTYLGHADVKSTYWYLEATPQLMTDIADAGEALASGEDQ